MNKLSLAKSNPFSEIINFLILVFNVLILVGLHNSFPFSFLSLDDWQAEGNWSLDDHIDWLSYISFVVQNGLWIVQFQLDTFVYVSHQFVSLYWVFHYFFEDIESLQALLEDFARQVGLYQGAIAVGSAMSPFCWAVVDDFEVSEVKLRDEGQLLLHYIFYCRFS